MFINCKMCNFSARKKMGFLQVCLVLISFFISARRTESCSGTEEFTFYDPVNPGAQETCKRCPKCPPGNGLEKQCGSKVPHGTFTGCKPCKYNETYSDKNDTSHCKPCHQCGFRIVLQQCTPWQNRRCAASCRSGYYMDTVLDKCKVVSGNKTTPRTMAMTTAELNSATVQSFPKTAPTQSPEQTLPVVHGTLRSTSNTTLATENPSAYLKIESTPSPDQDSKELKGTKITLGCIIGIVVGSVVFITLTVLVIYIVLFQLKRSCTCKTHSHSCEGDDSSAEKIQKESSTMDGPAKKYHNAEDKIRTPLLKDQSNANSTTSSSEQHLPNGVSIPNIDVQRIPEDIRISAMDKLWDHDGHLMLFYVQDVLDVNETVSVKTWFSVGLALKATRQEMNKIELQCCQAHGSPTQNLLQFFCTKGEAEPTMRDFVNALIECKRYEAARDICSWPYELSGFTTGAMPGSRLGETRPQSITG